MSRAFLRNSSTNKDSASHRVAGNLAPPNLSSKASTRSPVPHRYPSSAHFERPTSAQNRTLRYHSPTHPRSTSGDTRPRRAIRSSISSSSSAREGRVSLAGAKQSLPVRAMVSKRTLPTKTNPLIHPDHTPQCRHAPLECHCALPGCRGGD